MRNTTSSTQTEAMWYLHFIYIIMLHRTSGWIQDKCIYRDNLLLNFIEYRIQTSTSALLKCNLVCFVYRTCRNQSQALALKNYNTHSCSKPVCTTFWIQDAFSSPQRCSKCTTIAVRSCSVLLRHLSCCHHIFRPIWPSSVGETVMSVKLLCFFSIGTRLDLSVR
jgi:hypothetical protein